MRSSEQRARAHVEQRSNHSPPPREPSSREPPPPAAYAPLPPPPLALAPPRRRLYGDTGSMELALALGYTQQSGFLGGGGFRRFVADGVGPGLEASIQQSGDLGATGVPAATQWAGLVACDMP